MGVLIIGRKSAGLLLIVVGMVFAINQWTSLDALSYLQYIWLLALGLILVEGWFGYQRSMAYDEKPSFHKPSLALIVFVTAVSMLFSQGITNNIAIGIPFVDSMKTSADWSEEIPVSNQINEFYLDIPNAKLEFVAHDEDYILIDGVVRGNQSNGEEVMSVYENQLTVEERDHVLYYSLDPETMFSFFSSGNQLELEANVSVPGDLLVNAKVVNGSMGAHGFVQDMVLQSTNGNIQVADHDSSLEAVSTNGKISLEFISGNINAQTTNGNIDIIHPGKSGQAKTTNGSITIEYSKVEGDWELRGTNGRINLALPDGADAVIEGQTTNGSVSGPLIWSREYEDSNTRQDRQGSAIMNEGTHRIDARTVNGGVQVNLTSEE